MIATVLLIADVIVKNPCANIDPDSWAWIWSGCWIIGSRAGLAFGVGATMAAYVGIQLWARRSA